MIESLTQFSHIFIFFNFSKLPKKSSIDIFVSCFSFGQKILTSFLFNSYEIIGITPHLSHLIIGIEDKFIFG